MIKKKINPLTRKHIYYQRDLLKAKSWVFKTIKIDNHWKDRLRKRKNK